MKQLIWILLFGKMILLTESPVNLGANEWFSLDLKKPIQAINGGATIFIQVPIDDPRIVQIKGSDDIFKDLSTIFPKKTIEARLENSHGEILLFNNFKFSVSDFSLSKEESVRIKLTTDKSVPTNLKFESIAIKSVQPINNAKIFWKNYSQ